jgi:hypothetical protein
MKEPPVNKRPYLVLFTLITLIVVALACSPSAGDTEDRIATAVAQTLTAGPSLTTLSVSEVSTDDPKAEQLSPEPDPTDTPIEWPGTIEGLKEELFIAGFGGGEPRCDVIPTPPKPDLPAIRGADRLLDRGALCLFGFPVDEEISIDLYAPTGDYISSHAFAVDDLDPWDLWETDGVSVIRVFLWWPAGMPTGEWYAAARSVSTYVEGPFAVEARDGPAISTVPDLDLNPFENRGCDSYSADEEVTILGVNFQANKDLPLGIYYETQEESDGLSIVALVRGKIVTTDTQGNFSTSFRVGASDPNGTYYVIAVINPDSDIAWPVGYSDSFGSAGPSNCFSKVP